MIKTILNDWEGLWDTSGNIRHHINGAQKNLDHYEGKVWERFGTLYVYLKEINTKDGEYRVRLAGSMRGMELKWLTIWLGCKF